MELIQQNIAESLVVLGIILLAIEIAILGFATFILFFIGLSLIISGGLIWFDILPSTLASILLSNAILTAILAGALWQPLKRMQESTDDKKVATDFDGLEFVLDADIDEQKTTTYAYSGISWQVKSTMFIRANTKVKVVKADVGTFWVEAC